MWHLKFKTKHSDCIYYPLLDKYSLSIDFYPLNHYYEKGYIFTSAIQIIHGEKNSIRKYIKELKKHPKVIKLEESAVIFTLTKQKTKEKTYSAVYNPKLIYLTPAYNSSDGYEIWEIGCWDRKPIEELIKVIKEAKTTTYFEILRFEEKKNEEVYILSVSPKLPERQKKALELAYRYGYYNIPRKINLSKLSEIMGVSKQTFQENLTKAESKLMPLLLRT